ncbi:uncharacterized protein LOC134271588 [Saccostrea cucullata]|uniref:uncharacterized protein LOC134271588 n=1 Tax=Saccostrea cuccullata TaxID=36930 RepID=UPI002ED0142A
MSSGKFTNITVSSENVTQYSSLEPGDQLAVEGEMSGIDYYHHGIFIGHKEGIIDFGGPDKKSATVRRVDLLQFTDYGRRRLVRITYPEKDQCLPPEDVVWYAEGLFENPHIWGPYDIIKNNCEHFATKCKTGIAVSNQVIQKIRDCIQNPFQIFKYAVSSSKMSSGSLSRK